MKTTILSLVPDALPAAAMREDWVEREHRYAVMLSGTIRKAKAGNRMAIRIRNISSCGLMCECKYPVRLDDHVEVDLPHLGVVSGHIRWGAEGRIGIEFDGPIDPTRAWAKPTQSQVLFEMPAMDTRRPGFVSAS